MAEPPGDYEDVLSDADGLVAQVKLYRGIIGSAARGSKGVALLLALLLPSLKELLGEVKGALAGTPEPRGDDPPAPGSTDPLSDLERLLGAVEGALTRRN
jgi:hypothetical protein